MIELGRIYKVGDTVPQDSNKSEKWTQKAVNHFETLAESGDLDAKLGLGLLYLTGDLIEIDFEKGSSLIYDAARKGHTKSQYHHAVLLADERFHETVSDRFYFWMRKAAKGGDIEAQKIVAFCSLEGWFRDRNPKESLGWWLKAAEQGDAESRFNAGLMFFKGEGTKKNPKEAFNHWTKAAQEGIAIAHHNLAVMYQNSLGIKKDDTQASRHFSSAKKLGYEPKTNEEETDDSGAVTTEKADGDASEQKNRQKGDSGIRDMVHLGMYLPNEFRVRLIRSSSYAFKGPPSYWDEHPHTDGFGYDEATSVDVIPRRILLESERTLERLERAEELRNWRESQQEGR